MIITNIVIEIYIKLLLLKIVSLQFLPKQDSQTVYWEDDVNLNKNTFDFLVFVNTLLL